MISIFLESRLDKTFLCACGKAKFLVRDNAQYEWGIHFLFFLKRMNQARSSFTSLMRFKKVGDRDSRQHFLSSIFLRVVPFATNFIGWREQKKKRKRLRWRFGLDPAEQLSPGISFFFFLVRVSRDLNAPTFWHRRDNQMAKLEPSF